jgi:hypothetical protein
MAREFSLNESGTAIEDAVSRLPKKIGNRFRSAFSHIRRAWSLYESDKEMCAFRSITAEEEAATGLILALKERGYPGSEQLKHRDHTHKMLVFRIIQAFNNMVAELLLPPCRISITTSGPPKILLHIGLSEKLGTEEPLFATPDNPLNIWVSAEKDSLPHKILDGKLQELFSDANFPSLDSYLRSEANRRNLLLYASDEGVPSVNFDLSFIETRLQRVVIMSGIAIAILQDEQQQLLVRQCLEAALASLPKLTPTGFDYFRQDAPGNVELD